ncbi:MAG: hypothetical protein Q8N99_08205 [Nanoarchaeota archaeon]|nr:hypothetical protein [Nanoarchaeota archaeon]
MKRNFGGVLNDSWKEYKANFWTFFKIIFFLYFMPIMIFTLLNFLSLFYFFGDLNILTSPDYGKIMINNSYNMPFISYILFLIPLYIILGLVYLIMSLSAIYCSINSNKKLSFSASLAGGKKHYWNYLKYNLVILGLIILFILIIFVVFLPFTLLGIIGLIIGVLLMIFLTIAFIILMIKFGISWMFAPYLIVEQNKKAIDSLKTSYHIVKGKWWGLFGYVILLILIFFSIALVVGLIQLMISFILALPYISLDFSAFLTGNLKVPLTITIIQQIIGPILNFLINIIAIPILALFIKNLYFDIKKIS